MIKTPLSTVIGGAFWTPGATIIGSSSKNLTQLIKSLFSLGEQGFAYDPNDLTAEKINWRRNLLTETEFRNGINDSSIRAGSLTPVAFAGLTAGTAIQVNKATGGTYIYKSATYKADTPYTFSCYVRMLDGTAPRFGMDGVVGIDICLVVKGASNQATVQDLGGGLYRAYATVNSSSEGMTFGVVKYATNSTKPVIVSGYQLEEASQPSTYQPFTDFNSEFLKQFPLHTLYQDAAGTTPVIAAGQPVGLMKDKSGRNNHAYQTVSAMRPLLVAAPQRLDYDAVDDKLITNLPAQLTGCTVIRSVPNVGTQILTNQTIPTTHNDNIGNCGLIVINRALTASETSQITKLFNKAAGV